MEGKISFEDSGKIFRIVDTLEGGAVSGWLSASGMVSKSVISAENALQHLKKHYKEILINYPTLRLKIIKKDNSDKQYWCYANDDEIQFDNLIKIIDDAPLDDEIPTFYEPDIAPLWRVHLSQIKEKTKIKVLACHAITDGRCIFDLLDIFASNALEIEYNDRLKNAKNQPTLYQYGKKDWFTEEITERKIDDPYSKIILEDIKINPLVSIPSHSINPQWNVDYSPINKFCKKHKVTPQSILMAIQNEAIRKFHQGKYDDMPIAMYIPVDNRHTPYATELFKKSIFFSHIGFIMPFMVKEDDIYENIKNCAKLLKDNLATTYSCDVAYFSANMINYETGETNFPKCYPNPLNHLFSSHLGLVGIGYENVQFRSLSPVLENMYWSYLYAFHNNDTFSFVFTMPYNSPEGFFDCVKNTSLKYYNYAD